MRATASRHSKSALAILIAVATIQALTAQVLSVQAFAEDAPNNPANAAAGQPAQENNGPLRKCGPARFHHTLEFPSILEPGSQLLYEPLLFSPDSQIVYVAGYANGLQAFDAQTGEMIFQLANPAGQMIARNTADGKLQVDFYGGPMDGAFILEHGTGKVLAEAKIDSPDVFKLPGQEKSLYLSRFSHDKSARTLGRMLDRRVVPPQLRVRSSYGIWASLSPQGNRIAQVADTLRMISTVDGKALYTVPVGNDVPVTWSADGKYLYYLHDSEQALVELSVPSGIVRALAEHREVGRGKVQLSQDQKLLAYPSQDPHKGNAQWIIAQREDGAEVCRFDARPALTHGAFAPDGKSFWLLSEAGLARCDLQAQQLDPVAADALFPIDALAFAPDGQQLHGIAGNRHFTWDVTTGKQTERRQIPGRNILGVPKTRCVILDPRKDTTWWLSGDGFLRRLQGAWATVSVQIATPSRSISRDAEPCFAVSPNNRWIVYAKTTKSSATKSSAEGHLIVRDLWNNGEERELLDEGEPAITLAIAPDNSTLGMIRYESNTTSTVETWNLLEGKPIQSYRIYDDHRREAQVTFSADSQELRRWTEHLTIYDAHHEDESSSRRHKLNVPGARLDGGNYGLSKNDELLQLVDIRTSSICRTWKLPDARPIMATAISANHRLLAVAGPDARPLILDVYGTQSPRSADGRTFEQLWEALANAEPVVAFDAVAELIRRGEESTKALQEIVAVELPGDVPSLIKLLDSDSFQIRAAATLRLQSMPSTVRKEIEAALKDSPTPRQKTYLDQIRYRHASSLFANERYRNLRVIEVLEAIDTPAAHELLQTLAARDDESRLTLAAVAAWQKIKHRYGEVLPPPVLPDPEPQPDDTE